MTNKTNKEVNLMRKDTRQFIQALSSMYDDPEVALYIIASESILMSKKYFHDSEAAIGHVLSGIQDGIFITYTNSDPLLEEEKQSDLFLKDVEVEFPH